MVTVKNGKANGQPAKFVLTEGLTKQEQNLFLDFIEGAYFHGGQYIILPIQVSPKDAIREIMLEMVKSNQHHTNGHYVITSAKLVQKITEAEKYSDLANIYKEYSFTFNTYQK